MKRSILHSYIIEIEKITWLTYSQNSDDNYQGEPWQIYFAYLKSTTEIYHNNLKSQK